jgi:5-methyltetrahydropteroyltriglutamate--homocysteine methyltransferase
VVGSYPFPDWLGALPSEQAVIDATRVVIHTQEQAGIDLVCDGELYRFDVNHPETNGMIEYFVKPMAGVRSAVTFDELVAYRRSRDEIPHPSAGRRGRADRPRHARSAAGLCARPQADAAAVQVHPDRPAHARQDALRRPLPRPAALAMAIADALAAQVTASRRRGRAGRRGEPAGQPGRMGMGGGRDEPRARRREDRAGGASVFRQLRRPDDPEGRLGAADRIPQRAARRSYRDGDGAPAGRGAQVFRDLRPEIGFGLGVVDIKSTEIETADQIARAIERADQVLGADRIKYIHPDCGFWMLKRNIADGKIRALVQGRDLHHGRAG